VLQKFRLSAMGLREPQAPQPYRERILRAFQPLPEWYPPFEDETAEGYPYHAITQRPAAMYHSWGTMNAWLRQLHTSNVLYVPSRICDAHGLRSGDWVWLSSRHGRIRVQIER